MTPHPPKNESYLSILVPPCIRKNQKDPFLLSTGVSRIPNHLGYLKNINYLAGLCEFMEEDGSLGLVSGPCRKLSFSSIYRQLRKWLF